VEIILGRVTSEVYVEKFIVGIVWLLIFVLLFLLTWREGVKRFSAVGA
jgi:ABC-type uncharacterized transport system permease subunit